jgi:Putative adhesin
LGKAETESDMSNQEMQFADPDWKPSQKLDAKTGAQQQETFIPEPVNADSRERWNATPPPPPRQEMYTGLPPYAGATPQQPVRGQYRQGQYRRGGRSLWFWIILAFIILSLMSGGFSSVFNRSVGPDFGRMGQPHSSSVIDPAQNFTVSGTPTVVINGDGGVITVQTSANGHSVIVQDTRNGGFFGNSGDPNNIQVTSNRNGDTITTNVQDNGQGSVDFTVTVPQGADLQFNTSSGDITVDGVSGQVALQTDSGNVIATNDTFSGTSTIQTNSGDVGLSQTTLSNAATISTQSGDINFTVPAGSAFHLNASTSSGSINTGDFPKVTVNQAGTQATGNVGTASQGQGATVTLNTDNGNINLNQGP